MSKMLRNYQYLVGNNLDRSFEGATLKEYVEGVTSTAVTGLLGMAPEELDTLGELSSAIQNNPDFLTTLQGRDADLLAAIGISAGARDIGALTTPELPDDETVKALFEAVGEASRRLREGLGVAQGDSDMGTFTGTVIPDAASVKAALQALETFVESNSAVAVQTYVDAQIASDMWLFADQAAFPAAASNHGRVVHSHADGAMFYAHAGAWHKLQTDSAIDGDESSLQAAIDAAVARIDALELDPTTAAAVAAVAADLAAEENARLSGDASEASSRQSADNALDARLDVLEADPTTQTAVDAVSQSLTISLNALAGDIAQNETDSDAADTALSGRLDALELDATTQTAVDAVQGDVDANEAASDAAEAALSLRLDGLELDPTTQAAVDAVQADVDQNEANANAAIALKANINSPTLTGTPAAPTAAAGASTTQVATTAFVSGAIADLIDGAPATIDTLNEIAAALGDDPNLATTLTNSIAVVQADVDQNELDADAGDLALSNRLDVLEVDPTTNTAVTNAIAVVQADVDQNETDADAAIAAENAAMLAAVAVVQADVNQNETDSDSADAALSARIATLETDPTTGTSVAAEAAHIDNLVTLSGVAKDSTHLGDFSGTTIASNQTVKQALQSLETSIETFDVAQGVADIVDGTTNFTGFKLQNTTVLATGTELNFVDGVTSNIQDQLDAIQADVDSNESDADTAIAAVQADVDQNESDADAAIAVVQADVDANEVAAAALVTAQNTAMLAAVAVVQADVDQNEADADAALALKADLASPALTGTPTAPTASGGNNTTQLATTAFVSAAIAATIDSAPGALDTLNELAAAIGDDANFATTITNSIAAVQSDVDQNELDGDNADAALSGRLDTLEADATTATAVAAVQADVDQNEADADAAIALKLDASAVSTFGGTLIDDADAATARTTLGLGTAATTAATAYATAAQGTKADNALPAANVSTFGGTLVDDADAAAARTTLGLGDIAITAVADYATAAQGTLADSAVQPADISNVDNTSDANKPVSTATQTALDLKANAANAALTGTPTAPTAAADTNTTQVATTAYVQQELTDLIGAAPAGLNTLEELADAIENDVAAIENVTTLINTESGHVDNLATLSGVAKDSLNLGAFTGSTIADNLTLKAALQALETAVEDTSGTGTFADLDIDSGAVTYNEGSGVLVSTAGFVTSGVLTVGGTVNFTSTSTAVNFNDTAKFSNGLTDAADDTAAAAAGVAVGELYRNGSVVMIRVA